jgi:ribosome biogenesis GTPase / thiamine phosphate phosphatase
MGTVLSAHGQFAKVLTGAGEERRLRCRKKVGPLASGDQVQWLPEGRAGTIVEREERRTVLNRFDDLGRPRPVAANLDLVLVVWAPRPPSPAGFLDRYLATLTLQGLAAAVIANKIDLDTEAQGQLREQQRTLYNALDYPWLDVSAHSQTGLDALKTALAQRCSALVGQSGVGKSSLVNALGGRATQTTGNLTEDESHGRHTTSASRLLELPGAIRIIDSPGIRNFATGHIPSNELQHGFPEIAHYAQSCRFRNCLHQHEPGCAVLSAVDERQIDASRIRSYLAMLDDSQLLAAGRFS